MTLLILGLLLWTLAHGVKIHAPGLRTRLVAASSEGAVKIGFTLALIASVALMVYGYQQADYVALWTPPGWTVHLNNLLMVFAILIYSAGAFKGHVRAWIRHPQLAGTKTWAIAHLLANGHLAAVLLFGWILLWAVAAMVGLNKRDGKGPKPAAGPWWMDAVHVVVALVLVVAIGWVHNYLGVWPFAGDPPA
ncbi:MAG: NnrU family protein [Pikeienuella sp.]